MDRADGDDCDARVLRLERFDFHPQFEAKVECRYEVAS